MNNNCKIKTVGILSFISSENYGANLQAVALQYKLNEFKVYNTYINYKHKEKLSGIRKLKHICFSCVRQIFGYKLRKKKTDIFRSKYLSLSDKVNSYDDLSKITIKYDSFIVGSDQVWNPRFVSPEENGYLLSFENSKPKYSYGSSFGVAEIEESDKVIYRNALNKFAILTVRENSGCNIIKDLGINAEVVLDPTLLLDQYEWLNFYNPKPIKNCKYILCYVMNGDNLSIDYIRRYASNLRQSLDCDYNIYFIGDKEYKRLYFNYNLICDAGPSEFLNLIHNASYVITNSFHGTCFAINFKKQFKTILRRTNRFNTRIEDLLNKLSLDDFIQYIDEDIHGMRQFVPPTEESICKLVNLRNDSLNILKQIAENNKNI
ncbi:MAG: polysaccharide pyruvyl transferase family protein [Rikenellaceae bacterium]